MATTGANLRVGAIAHATKSNYDDAAAARKAGLSCAECRRSKLKCDRVFPCQSCVRRGCAAICPDGTLAATKGNKVLMARAEKLSHQVKSMAVRIEELEQALAEAQLNTTGQRSHPLLAKDAVKWEEPPDSESELELLDPDDAVEAIGSLSIDEDGRAQYHGNTADTAYLKTFFAENKPVLLTSDEMLQLGLPTEIQVLANAFPFGLSDPPRSKTMFAPFIPRREQASYLGALYYSNTAWMYEPVPRKGFTDLMSEIFDVPGDVTLESVHSHRISLFYMFMAIGSLFNGQRETLWEAYAEQYHALARAAMSYDSVVTERTSSSVQTLFMLSLYRYLSSRPSNEWRWIMTGLTVRVAQAVGLQRDSVGWNLDADELQRRRTIFWELYTWDAWTGIISGRPPAMNLRQANSRFPEDLWSVEVNGHTEMGFHAWKYRFSAACMSSAVALVFNSRTAAYSTMLDLDVKVRGFGIPSHLRTPVDPPDVATPWSDDASRAMQQCCLLCTVECILLYIHRSYFAQVRKDPGLQHQFAPSVWAVFSGACRIVRAVKGLHSIHPGPTSNMWYFWVTVFSSSVLLGSLVLENPGCSLARAALAELDSAYALYEAGPKRAVTATFGIIEELRERAHTVFNAYLENPENPLPLDEKYELPTAEYFVQSAAKERKKSAKSRSTGSSPSTSKESSQSPPTPYAEVPMVIPGSAPPDLPSSTTFATSISATSSMSPPLSTSPSYQEQVPYYVQPKEEPQYSPAEGVTFWDQRQGPPPVISLPASPVAAQGAPFTMAGTYNPQSQLSIGEQLYSQHSRRTSYARQQRLNQAIPRSRPQPPLPPQLPSQSTTPTQHQPSAQQQQQQRQHQEQIQLQSVQFQQQQGSQSAQQHQLQRQHSHQQLTSLPPQQQQHQQSMPPQLQQQQHQSMPQPQAPQYQYPSQQYQQIQHQAYDAASHAQLQQQLYAVQAQTQGQPPMDYIDEVPNNSSAEIWGNHLTSHLGLPNIGW